MELDGTKLTELDAAINVGLELKLCEPELKLLIYFIYLSERPISVRKARRHDVLWLRRTTRVPCSSLCLLFISPRHGLKDLLLYLHQNLSYPHTAATSQDLPACVSSPNPLSTQA
jgi:hypothetical protein